MFKIVLLAGLLCGCSNFACNLGVKPNHVVLDQPQFDVENVLLTVNCDEVIDK